MNNELKSGDIMFGPIGGVVPGLFPVGAGQVALFLTRRWWRMVHSIRRWFRIRHVGVVDCEMGSWYLTQAMPGGVECIPLDHTKHLTSEHVYIRPAYMPGQGVDVADAAFGYKGTPYGFATYLKLAAGAFRMRATEALLRRWISTRDDMICSQHVDQSLADAGYHVFGDGRLPQDVVPAELFEALLAYPGWFMIPGHPVFGEWTLNEKARTVKEFDHR
jgi:hypothetical protein